MSFWELNQPFTKTKDKNSNGDGDPSYDATSQNNLVNLHLINHLIKCIYLYTSGTTPSSNPCHTNPNSTSSVRNTATMLACSNFRPRTSDPWLIKLSTAKSSARTESFISSGKITPSPYQTDNRPHSMVPQTPKKVIITEK